MIELRNLEKYIILPGQQHGSYSYPDLSVGMHRLGYDADVKEVAETRGLNLQNTAVERRGHQYIGYINREQALRLNLLLGNFTLNPRHFVDFKNLLEDGVKDKRVVYDGKGAVIDSKVLEGVYDEIFTKRGPWRAEWLDAYFRNVDGVLHINYDHRDDGGQLTPQRTEPLENCLMEDAYADLASANRQGIPTRKSMAREIYFWHPRNGAVAGFWASSGRVGLYAGWGPADSGSSLGVRPARIR